ncbi:hypothetical protein TREES_T100013187 [Tupaia chinensis]|uniref:Uncharacterized protein n=1 Tax=Tupaia chinensis TaxID=246437 RepID=L9KNA4_TUPCH|nr:hypothetical protein TREES_T100013187 [Tupaia chinensis]
MPSTTHSLPGVSMSCDLELRLMLDWLGVVLAPARYGVSYNRRAIILFTLKETWLVVSTNMGIFSWCQGQAETENGIHEAPVQRPSEVSEPIIVPFGG